MATETTKTEKLKRSPGKYLHSNAHSLNSYNKKIMLNILTSSGCHTEAYESVKSRMRKSKPGAVEDFVELMATNSQENVAEECDLPLFESLNAWAEHFKERNIPEDCEYELPLAFKSIAHLEKHPSPSKAGGVDFYQLYNFLANVCRGDPAVSLDEPTAGFLQETFEELQTAVGSPDGVSVKTKMMSAMMEKANILTIVEGQDEFPRALDPLNIEM